METITNFFDGVVNSNIFLLTLSIVAYYVAVLINQRIKSLLCHPILVSSLIVIGVLLLIDVDYQTYNEANEFLYTMLNISVVCLSYLMHKNLGRIKQYRLSLIVSTFIGSVVGLLSIWGLSLLFGCDEAIMLSLLPKSITSAVAVSLCDVVGGIPALTVLGVVVAGISGSIIGPRILTLCRVTDPVAVGAAMGSASHAVGTARALELGALQGAVGGAAICLMALFTSLLLPLFLALLPA
ncbi:MAG: LrgB family protein [Rikenellaceae bacterium]